MMPFRSTASQATLAALLCALLLGIASVRAEKSDQSKSKTEPKIAVNQIGYLPHWPKRAWLLNASKTDREAELIDADTRKPVRRIAPGEPQSLPSDLQLQILDFSPVVEEGTYYIRHDKLESPTFAIGKAVYESLLVALLHSYYLHRCGVALRDSLSGITRPACHTTDAIVASGNAIHKSGTRLDAAGGWHSGPGYQKDVMTTAIATGRLLSLYEHAPQYFLDGKLDLPESGNRIPDLLDELQVGLNWLLRMQRGDGYIYRTVSVSPNIGTPRDAEARFVYGNGAKETAAFAAVMAMAARAYKFYAKDDSERYLQAALSSWSFLERFSGRGAQPDESNSQLWAALELNLTTAEARYIEFILQHLESSPYSYFHAQEPAVLGMTDFIFNLAGSNVLFLHEKIKRKVVERADALLMRVVGQTTSDTGGSNRVTAENGITLLSAYRITRQTAYLEAAVDRLDFLLGRNRDGCCFVTGFGARPVQNARHVFTGTEYDTPAGLLVSGVRPPHDGGLAVAPKPDADQRSPDRKSASDRYSIENNASLVALIVMLMSVQ